MSGIESLLFLLGRIAIGAFFLWKAFERMQHWTESAEALRRKRVPYVSYTLPLSMLLLVVGGLSLVLGFYARGGAMLLLIYMVAHMYMFHAFWHMEKGTGHMLEKLLFMKDFAIVGSLLLILAAGGGSFSVHA